MEHPEGNYNYTIIKKKLIVVLSNRYYWVVYDGTFITILFLLLIVEKPLGADDILPIFIYILVQANIPNVLSLNHELQSFCDPEKRLSEDGYYLATFGNNICIYVF